MKNEESDLEENERLIHLLTDLIQILHAHNIKFWAARFEDALERCQRFDPYGLVKITESYGGMGSINDLQINAEMNELVTQIYDLAHHLLQKVEARDRISSKSAD